MTALALVKKGIPVTLLESEPEPPEDQRAATIHPPTVEMLAELGLKDEAFADDASGGLLSPIFHFRDRVSGELVAVFDLNLLKGEVPYPFVVQWEQYKLVRAAQPHIEESGIADVRFSTKVTGLVQSADHVDVTVHQRRRRNRDASRRAMSSAPTAGAAPCGARPEIEFEGFTWAERFIKIAHQLRLRRDRPRLLHPQLFFRPRTSGSTCSRSTATARPGSGAASCRSRRRRATSRR